MRNWRRPLHVILAAALALASSGCAPKIPKDALVLSPESLQDRQIQTRVFETGDEGRLLSASAEVLQDLGFTIEASEVPCGLIVCSKDRDVTSTSQIIGSILVGVLTGVAPPIDKHQKVVASLVTRPIGESRVAVRITFQHMVWNTQNQMVRNETIKDAEVYQEFFDKLSKSVFLTGQGI
jgi:hypothetical protein